MRIVMHQHNVDVSDATRTRIARAVEKAAQRLTHAVEAVVRVERDGQIRRVELVVLVPRRSRIVAVGEARSLDSALALATSRLGTRAARRKDRRGTKTRVRAASRASSSR